METVIPPDTGRSTSVDRADSFAFDRLIHASPATIERLFDSAALRSAIGKVFEWSSRRSALSFKEYPRQVQLDKFYITRSLIRSLNAAIDAARDHPVMRASLSHRVLPAMFEAIGRIGGRETAFAERYGFPPPRFLVLSPTRFCNLRCAGCYANSDAASKESLPFETVDRIISEKTETWGGVFTVISGGEPLLYKNGGKTIFDLALQHQDNYFLMYTNGTLIDAQMARRFAEAGNITPAISVEGFEAETDRRRGAGAFARALRAMELLRAEGVPFGVSLTATRENAEIIPSRELVEFYAGLGALYFWIFQLMPIGRASMDLMPTARQRFDMYHRMHELIERDRYFIADFWNGGTMSNGCISAGSMRGGGYLYIDWAGNVTPCVFNPYAGGNVNEIYARGGELGEVLVSPYFEAIQRWQTGYALQDGKFEGNWVLPCPMRDHYANMLAILQETKPTPTDETSARALEDREFREAMLSYDRELEELFGPLWREYYLKRA